MKTKTIKLLKKELLVIELPINGYWEVLSTETRFKCFDTGEKLILKNYTLLGKPDEIKEDDLEGLFKEYKDGYFSFNKSLIKYNTKIRAFNKLIESEIYWDVNPLGHSAEYYSYIGEERHWYESELRTFDKKRTLIFVKN